MTGAARRRPAGSARNVPRTPLPGIIRAASAAWFAAAALVAVAGVSFIVSAGTQHRDGAGLTVLGLVVLAVSLVIGFCVFRLRAGKRSARETLTTVGVIVGIPLLFRGPALIAVGSVLLLCVLLLWLPQSSRFFQEREPKARRRLFGR
ncbi:hypothetical protein QNO08_14230 [Arthrobacter sp. zg-Y820]|uniref:hypothetical protein n=1 Tax=unclassified Arthrobacter TaxID=235627 RepID=UPI001E3C1FAC|nr:MULTISPECIES: hypothetical protein [unclassified Arthrobacter]MCC9195734.1 hypothetical protein [Arthrobacter sp. zg-Y820]MDK1278593.1 hypothetical protein [Arthrobacter sp. zg.Y820]WIB08974.1 hypothetical protein QNO08_14230 [Arthrobacter sp. zg-Y820]